MKSSRLKPGRPPQRRTQMKRTEMKRTGWKRKPPADPTAKPKTRLKRNREIPVPKAVRKIVRERSGGVCERCHCCKPREMHHRVTKARGRFDHPLNLADLCKGPGSCDCHGEVHRLGEFPWILPGRFDLDKFSGQHLYVGPYDPFVSIFGKAAA